MARRCGYCREYNHQKNKCKKLASEVEYIRKYIPAEIMNIHNALVQHGWGIGAMVEITDWDGTKYIGIVDDLRGIFTSHGYTDYRNVKYSKQVKTYLKNMTGKYIENIPENILFTNRHEIQFQVLNPSNPSSRIYATVTRDTLGFGAASAWNWATPSVLLSPSYETNATYSDFLDMNIHLNERLVLAGDDHYVKGLAI